MNGVKAPGIGIWGGAGGFLGIYLMLTSWPWAFICISYWSLYYFLCSSNFFLSKASGRLIGCSFLVLIAAAVLIFSSSFLIGFASTGFGFCS